MIYMKEYWSEVDHPTQGECIVSQDVFVVKGEGPPLEYTWKDLDEFIEQRARHDYLGKHFGGALFRVGCMAHVIQTLQFFRTDTDFPEMLQGAWIRPHISACQQAWYAASAACDRLGAEYENELQRTRTQEEDEEAAAAAATRAVWAAYIAVREREPSFYEQHAKGCAAQKWRTA